MPQPISVLSLSKTVPTKPGHSMEGKSNPGLGADLTTEGQSLSLPIWDPCWVDLEGDVARGGIEGHALPIKLQRFHLVPVVTAQLLTSFL